MRAKRCNHARVSFESRSGNEGFSRTVVASFVAALDPTIAELTDIKTAVSEAVTNCIVHAYPDKPGEIILDLGIYENAVLRIVVTDRGCGIADVSQAMTPLFTTGAVGERSGLGFSVMESFTDKLTVRSRVNSGTTITLHKIIKGRTR